MRQLAWIIALSVGMLPSADRGANAADTYTLDWQAVHAGAGTSSGGPYRVTGLVRRAGAGAAIGAGYTETAGLDPQLVVVAVSGELLTLAIQINDGEVSVSWTPNLPGFILESTDSLVVPFWEPSPSTNPAVVTVTSKAKYYRLRKP